MISEEKTRQNLLLAYKISMLYIKCGASTNTVSEITEVPLSTVKRSITTIGKRKKDYLRLLPELGDERRLNTIQELANEATKENIRLNKWNKVESPLSNFESDIEEIKEMYKANSSLVSDEVKMKIINLRYDGNSMRKIASETGVSLATVSTVVANAPKENKK